MRAGKLQHRLSIERKVETQSEESGELTRVWKPFVNLWGELVPLSGREFLASRQLTMEVIARATIRYREDINETMRIVHKCRYYNIVAILPDPTFSKHLTLMLSTGLKDG